METVTSPPVLAQNAVTIALGQIRPDDVVVCPGVASAGLSPLGDLAVIEAESAEAALGTCIEAAGTGRRVAILATSGDLAAMADVLPRVAALRLPVIMPIVGCTALPAGAAAGCPGSLAARDAGWIEIATETPQEAYDTLIQALRIAEHPDVRLPVILAADSPSGAGVPPVRPIDDMALQRLIGAPRPGAEVTAGGPMSAARPSSYFLQSEALSLVPPLLQALGQEFGRLYGRHYALLDTAGLADAQVAIVAAGSTAGRVRAILAGSPTAGRVVALVRPRLLRPFPASQLAEALHRARAVAVIERAATGNGPAPLYVETAAALQAIGGGGVRSAGYLYHGHVAQGLAPGHIEQVLADLAAMAEEGPAEPTLRYLNA